MDNKREDLHGTKSNNGNSKGVCSTMASIVIFLLPKKVLFLYRIYVLSRLRFSIFRYSMVAKVQHRITTLATRVWNIRLGYQSGSLSLHSMLLLLLPLVVVLPSCRVLFFKTHSLKRNVKTKYDVLFVY